MDLSEVKEIILSLSVEFIKHSNFNSVKSALTYFSDILGWDDTTEHFKPPHHYTTYLAQLKFCIRCIMLEHTLPQCNRGMYIQLKY